MTPPEAARMPLMAHLAELRMRLLWAVLGWLVFSCAIFAYAEDIYQFLAMPLVQASGDDGGAHRLIYTGLAEPFIVYLKLTMYGGFMAAFPWLALQVYLFLAPGLHSHEKRALIPYLCAAPMLFLMGASLAYYGVMPVAWGFFLSFEQLPGTAVVPLMLEARISEYIGIVCQFIMAFGLAFQMPIVLALLTQLGIVNPEALASKRRYAVVILLTLAAIFTPPDIVSQLLLFIPLLLLYECSIFICRRIEKNHARHKMDT
jgi:sec-independent protein translocase protein TatC